MSSLTGIVSLLVAVVLVMFAELPRSNAAVSISTASSNPLKVEYTTDNKKAVFKWSWTSQQDDTLYKIQINRLRQNPDEKELAYYNAIPKTYGPSGYDSYFELVVTPGSGGTGTVEFTIKDVKRQGTDSDGSAVDVLKYDYKYECAIISSGEEAKNQVTLEVDEKPRITTVPESYESSDKDKRFKMRCIATGKPLPSISWLVTRINGQENSLTGTKVTGLESFKYGSEIPVNSTNADTGLYKCTAKNKLGQDSAQATFVFTGCDSSITCDSKDVAIEITQLTYKNDYNLMSSEASKKLRKEIETACVDVYSKTSSPKILSCAVTKFRSGSVIATVKQVFKRGTSDPEGPLKSAIQGGKFAGYDVATSFVSPTSPPTEKPTANPTNGGGGDSGSPNGTPGSGQRTSNEGLSTGAIIAIVVVLTIIVIILIVAVIVFMIKRRKPSGSSKSYKEDGPATEQPLKSQPYKDPYDNGSDKPKEVVYADLNFQDRYPNGGGPPPQYTPSSNYAEVQPTTAEQNESGVEWDKSVKDEMWI